MLLPWLSGKDSRSNFQYPELDWNLDGPDHHDLGADGRGYVVIAKAFIDAEFDTHQRDDELA